MGMGAARCSRLTLPPSQLEGWAGASAFFFTEKIKAGLQRVLCAIWFFLEGILAETVLPLQAPVDIIYTLI